MTIEVEPVLVSPTARLSPEAERLLDDVVRLTSEEARRAGALSPTDDPGPARPPADRTGVAAPPPG